MYVTPVSISGMQVVVEALQAAVEAGPPAASNQLPHAMQLVTNIAVFMHALPHLDMFTTLSARYQLICLSASIELVTNIAVLMHFFWQASSQ